MKNTKKSILEDPADLTKQEVVKLIGCTEAQLNNLIRKGLGPRYIKFGNTKQARVRFRLSDIESWLEENTIQ